MDVPTPHRGLRFRHARQRHQIPGLPVREWPAEVCEVTAVRRGVVYFRNESGFLSSTRSWADSYGGSVD